MAVMSSRCGVDPLLESEPKLLEPGDLASGESRVAPSQFRSTRSLISPWHCASLVTCLPSAGDR
jgi:hypothetical protein